MTRVWMREKSDVLPRNEMSDKCDSPMESAVSLSFECKLPKLCELSGSYQHQKAFYILIYPSYVALNAFCEDLSRVSSASVSYPIHFHRFAEYISHG